jgi:hypothetical protein
MDITIPTKVRGWLYILNMFLAPLVVYLQADNLISVTQATLAAAWLAAISLLARMNLTDAKE